MEEDSVGEMKKATSKRPKGSSGLKAKSFAPPRRERRQTVRCPLCHTHLFSCVEALCPDLLPYPSVSSPFCLSLTNWTNALQGGAMPKGPVEDFQLKETADKNRPGSR